MATGGHTAEGGLLERETELAGISAIVAQARAGAGRVLLIEGEPGIGKTALLTELRHAAGAAGMATLPARAHELERDFGFGVVRQLFERVVRDGPAELLAGQARLAAPALGVEPAVPGRTKPPLEPAYPAVHGLYWLTLALAERGPLALLVDDAHWSDRASLRFLAYLAPRLEELPVLMAVTARRGEQADWFLHALGTPRVLAPQRLSAAATAAVVRSLAPAADDAACRACHAATRGNAFYVREVAAAIRDRGPGDPEPRYEAWSPASVTRAVAGRIAALSPGGREAARACAILGDGAPLHAIATLAGLDDDAGRAAVDSLRAGAILAPTARIEFIHPIVRSAVEASIPPGLRAGGHARAARLVAAAGAGPERIAVHLLAADPAEDAWACECLREAGREALSRGAPETAARYLERALEEPAPEHGRSRLLLDLGTALAFSFRSGAAAHVRRAFELAPTDEARLEAALLHAHLSLQAGRGADGLELLVRVHEESPPESSRALMIEGFATNFTRAQLSARRAARPIIDRLRARGDVGIDADPSVLIAAGAELAMAGVERSRAVVLARAALGRLTTIPPLMRSFAGLTATRTLIVADDHERARSELEDAMEAARSRGALFDFIYHAVSHANLAFRAGDLYESETDARSGYEIARRERWPLGLPSVAHYLVHALVERGELDDAWDVLRESRLDGPARELSDVYTTNALLLARSRLRLATGTAKDALADLEELRFRQEEFGEINPSLSPWRSEMALTLLHLGDRERAVALVAEEVVLARTWGAPRALGMALRAAGVVAGDEGGIPVLREAVTVLEGSFARLELGRALADLGDAVLARGERAEARALLRRALELTHDCGAAPLEDRVLAGLRRAGARPRRAMQRGADALTSGERRAAELAATGLTNRQIADRLFVTVRTVEYHLNNAYRKLGIDARSKLPAALDGGASAQHGSTRVKSR